jgi:putative transposase
MLTPIPKMTPTAFQQWCRALHLAPATCDFLATKRASDPVRPVTSRATNVSGTYPSAKMGVTIQYESEHVELWAILAMDHDPEVLEFYDQAHTFKIQYLGKSGKKLESHYYTPDFLVLRKTSVCFEEWKTEADLQRLAQHYPARYQQQEDGSWRCPPAEAAVESLGLTFRLRSSAELHPTYIDNLLFLADYFGVPLSVPVQVQTLILQRVREVPGIPLSALAHEGSSIRPNDVYAMLALELLYTDLYAALLIQHGRVRLYLNADQAHAYAQRSSARLTSRIGSTRPASPADLAPNTTVLWDGRAWTLLNPGETTTTLLPEKGPPLAIPADYFFQLLDTGVITTLPLEADLPVSVEVDRLLDQASPADLRQANECFARVMAYLQKERAGAAGIAPRTLHRWVARFREAETTLGCGYVGLLSRKANQGNRIPKAPEASRVLMDTFITEQFETPRRTPAATVYRAYAEACRTQNLPALSARAFYQRIKQRSGPHQTERREGARAAYQETPWFWELEHQTPRHGSRPFEIAHMDHTELDIELRHSTIGQLLGKPWLTLLMDAYSRRFLAVYLTFDPPSYRSVMMTLRICVQRFERMPQFIVVDGGKEFHSVYFESLLAQYRCAKKVRPWAKPHFGSVIERLFQTTQTEFIYTLLGNTQAAKRVRLLTRAVDPKEHALWTLPDLYTYLLEYAYQVYDQNDHSSLGMSPRAVYLWGLKQGGEREHRRIAYDERFLKATCPTTPKGTALVQKGSGIKLNHFYYWNTAFQNPEVIKTAVPVRYDPFDISTAYALVEGHWVTCRSPYVGLEGHTEKELLLATAELRKLAKRDGVRASFSAGHLASFIGKAGSHETLLQQHWRDLEGKKVLALIASQSSQPRSGSGGMPLPVGPPAAVQLAERLAALTTPVDVERLPMLEDYH